ncbi:MAG: hypothetical protein NVSMB67_17520 [Flavisolibacter sp.]
MRLKENPRDTFIRQSLLLLQDTSRTVRYSDLITGGGNLINYDQSKYDSIQRAMPAQKKDSWLTGQLYKKQIFLQQKFKGNVMEEVNYLWEKFLHTMPYMLFLSLPFFALILKLLYLRHKSFYYSDHTVFTLFHFIFSFMLILVIYAFIIFKNNIGSHLPLTMATVGLILIWPIYLFHCVVFMAKVL